MQRISLCHNFDPVMHQQQRLLMTTAMQQAICVMQLPIVELSEWIKNEIENNPVLEVQLPEWHSSESAHLLKTKKHSMDRRQPRELLENLIAAPTSLFDHLVSQARYHFTDSNTLHLAQWIIGHLNERGFLTTSLKELGVFEREEKLEEILQVIQTFDPPGVGARSLQESLLIQLKLKNKHTTQAYQIIEENFDDLLHNRCLTISKQLAISLDELSTIVEKDIIPLDLNPGDRFLSHYAGTIVPDLFLFCVDNIWKIEINHTFLPTFYLTPSYRKALEEKRLKPEEQTYLKKHVTSGKWLRHIVEKRKITLLKIGEFILKSQSSFFDDGTLVPLTMADAAASLSLHESTIARAVANKYIACPQGMFALKDFFCHSLKGEGGMISHHTLRMKLKELIAKEDKKKPFSDAEISEKLHHMKIPCARRTVAKYRRLLKIEPASRRKQWID